MHAGTSSGLGSWFPEAVVNFGIIFIKSIPKFTLSITKNPSTRLIDRRIPSKIVLSKTLWSSSFTTPTISCEFGQTYTRNRPTPGTTLTTDRHPDTPITRNWHLANFLQLCKTPHKQIHVVHRPNSHYSFASQPNTYYNIKDVTMFEPGVYPGYFTDSFQIKKKRLANNKIKLSA